MLIQGVAGSSPAGGANGKPRQTAWFFRWLLLLDLRRSNRQLTQSVNRGKNFAKNSLYERNARSCRFGSSPAGGAKKSKSNDLDFFICAAGNNII